MNQRVYYNDLWVFGDSYSDKAGLIPELESFYSVRNLQDWAEMLSEKLELNLNRHAMGGAGMGWIMNQFIENLTHIKKGDIVVISDTIFTRMEGVDVRDGKIKTLDNERLYYGEDVEEDNHLGPVYGKDKQRIITDYVIHFIHEYYNQWEKYYINQIKSLSKVLEDKGAELYFWSHRLWDVREKSRFSKIHEETDGLFRDSHWGLQGHIDFCDYLYDRIQQKDYFHIVEKPLF